MKNIIYIIIAVLIFQNTYSQQNTFSKVLYSETQEGITINKAIPSIDSGYIAVGNNGLIIKTDSIGDVEWGKRFAPYIKFNSVILTNDNNFVTVGRVINNSTNNFEGLVLKVDLIGDTIWSKTIAGNDNVELTSVFQTDDDGFILTGNMSNYPNFQSLICKIDSNGNFLWTKTIIADDFRSFLYSIKQTQFGNYIIVGYIERELPSSNWEFNYILLNFSEEGDLIWSKKYFTEYNYSFFKATDFEITNSGYVILVQRGSVTALYKTNFTGEVIWNKFHQSEGVSSPGEANQNLYTTSDGGFVYSYGSREGGGIIKTDSAGNSVSTSMLELEPISVSETNNEEYTIFGNGPLFGVKNYFDVIGIIQMDSLFNDQYCTYSFNSDLLNDTVYSEAITVNLTENLSPKNTPIQISSLEILNYEGCVGRTGSIDETKNNIIEIYPNPSKGNFTIESKNYETGILTIYNLQGQKITDINIKSSKTNLNLNTVIDGMYFYHFKGSDNQVYSGKMIIKR